MGPGHLPHGPHEQPLPISDRNPAGHVIIGQQQQQQQQHQQQQQQQQHSSEGALFEENSTSTAAAAYMLKSAGILKNGIQDNEGNEGDDWTLKCSKKKKRGAKIRFEDSGNLKFMTPE